MHCYHAQMEPMNCVAQVAADGQSAEVWTGTQSSALAALVASSVLKTTPDKIRVHQQLLGGGYGRRIWPDAAVAGGRCSSNITKKPVKLILTREDDLTAARPRPMTYHSMKAGLDGSGNLVGWHHRLVSENVDAVAAPPRFKATGGKDCIGWRGLEQPFYGVPNMLAEAVREQRGVRVHAWRGIGSGYNKFAAESFLDEIAHATGKDPLALRLELTKDHPRANAVIKRGRRDGGLEEAARQRSRTRHRLLRLPRVVQRRHRRGLARSQDGQDQGAQLLDRGRRRHRHAAGERRMRSSKARWSTA